MSSEKFPVGSRVFWPAATEEGVVTKNVKMPGDICIQWDCGTFSSYDEDFLVENKVGVITHAVGVLLPSRSELAKTEGK